METRGKMGRPPRNLESGVNRITVRFTSGELASLQELQVQHGFKSLSDVIRVAIATLIQEGRP